MKEVDNSTISEKLDEYIQSIRRHRNPPLRHRILLQPPRMVIVPIKSLQGKLAKDPDQYSLYNLYTEGKLRTYGGIGPVVEKIVVDIIEQVHTEVYAR